MAISNFLNAFFIYLIKKGFPLQSRLNFFTNKLLKKATFGIFT